MKGEKRNDRDRLHDRSPRTFLVSAKLSKSASFTGEIKESFDSEDGDSYLTLPDEALLSRVRCPDGMFEFHKNKTGRKSLVTFECTATSPPEARRKFQRAVYPFLDHLSYMGNCPIAVTAIRVEDPKNQNILIEYIAPYGNVVGYPHITNQIMEMRPAYALYREAINSHSTFYKFLCYYKILEGFLGPMRAKAFENARAKGKEIEKVKVLLPNVPELPPIAAPYIGKSVKAFVDEVLTPRYRNAVAHFITDDGTILNLSAPESIDTYDEIIFAAEVCVRTVISGHEALLQQVQG